jgi:hypothetical protein
MDLGVARLVAEDLLSLAADVTACNSLPHSSQEDGLSEVHCLQAGDLTSLPVLNGQR